MGKVILMLSFLGIGLLLIVAAIDPNSPMVWLASTSSGFFQLRAFMMLVLFALLVTNPPRNVYFSAIVGILSLIAVSWALSATYQNEMKLLDSLSILEVGICAGITVLEQDLDTVKAAKRLTA